MATIAVGPALPGIGSWEWLGTESATALQLRHGVKVFRDHIPNDCDAVLLLKSFPERDDVAAVAGRVPVVYCPIDRYGSSAEIDRHGLFLSRCAAIVIHCAALRKYFQSYAPVAYVDHPVKYVSQPRDDAPTNGHILCVAVRNNLPPIVQWANSTKLPAELWLLTDLPDGRDESSAEALGFAAINTVRVAKWTAPRHLEWASQARAAVDVKGNDFRARHKPPAKAIDFLASGLPLGVNHAHSARSHLLKLGLKLADVRDADWWFSDEYRHACREFGNSLREQLSPERIGERMQGILEQVIEKRVAA